MAFVVEDGTGLSNANSYCSVEDADSYHDARLHSEVWTSATTSTKEKALQMATFWLDTKVRWRGEKEVAASALRWPRSGVLDQDGNELDEASVPRFLKNAVAELARLLITEDRTQEGDTAGFKTIEVDSIRLEMSSSGATGLAKKVFPRSVADIVAPYGTITGEGGTVKLRRA